MKLRSAALLMLAVVVPACDPHGGYLPLPSDVVAAVSLSGSQVVPANATIAVGDARLRVVRALRTIDYTVNQIGLGTVTSVEVRVGAPGVNGPAIFTLATGPFANPLTGTLRDTDFTPVSGVATFNQALSRILDGSAYVLIRTVGSPNGELRGQLGPSRLLAARMSGAQVVAPVVTVNSGTFSIRPNPEQTALEATLTFSGIPSATSAHIHLADAGAGGPSIFDLSAVAFSSPLTVTLTSADFIAAGGLTTFEEAVNAILSGRTYVDVHTAAQPGGELRGQIGPARAAAALTAANVVPANSSTATGSATLALNGLQTGFTLQLTHSVAGPTGVLIHADVPGSNGPIIFNVSNAAGTSASPLEVFLDGSLLVPQPSKSVTTFADAVDAMLGGRTYLDISSSGFPAGEIRGPILP